MANGFSSEIRTDCASVPVELGDRRYIVEIGPGLLDETGSRLRQMGLHGRLALITDENVDGLYAPQVTASLTQAGYESVCYTVTAGEASKALATVQHLCDAMARDGFDRSAAVLALGGGVVGDLAGFVAGVYYRGVKLVQLPTTVMAQVDSAVGGKTAVNLPAGKNLVGVFHQPALVLADTASLQTLGPREWNEGFAEVIKYGVIRSPQLLVALALDPLPDLAAVIRECVQIKADIVAADEQETSGLRALLNFGHTLGHAIEAVAGYGSLFHGEAVALGMRAAAFLSQRRAGLSLHEVTRLDALLRRFSLPRVLPPGLEPKALLRHAFTDKKFVSGRIRFVLTPRFGEAFVSEQVTSADLHDAIIYLQTA
ncbi:MAG TPA: 3-dehydroquinate synthase [Chthoniobacterales bacterium]